MIRTALLWLYIVGFSMYAFKDWYRSLCALILLMAVVEHPDMPKSILGIPGLNPWNLLLLAVIAAWAGARSREHLTWDMPKGTSVLLFLYFVVIAIGLARMFADQTYLDEFTLGDLISEQVINTFKWVIPGLLLFDGCRSRERFVYGLLSVVGVYFLLAVQVIKWMPLDSIQQGTDLAARSLKILSKEVGYHRVNLSAMLAGGSWAILTSSSVATTRSRRWLLLGLGLATAFAQALTGGRTGYATWGLIGLVVGTLRWRRVLALVPVAVLIVIMAVPGAQQRMLQGLDDDSRDTNTLVDATTAVSVNYRGEQSVDAYTVTAGRSVIWPFVLDKIGESPLFGYGRLAMKRVGLERFLEERFNESFPHPHNAYLELLLDNGIFGFVIVMPFYLLTLGRAFILLRDRRCPEFTAIGGMTASLILALLIASFGSQTFYPREGWVGLWCAFGLATRMYVERRRVAAAAAVRPTVTFGSRVPTLPLPVRPAIATARTASGPDFGTLLWRPAQ